MHEKTWSCHCFNGAEKNSREKCQQPIAAGFCCRRRHGLWFPHVSFLSHYASSSHPIKHKYRLQLREHLGTAPPGRNRQRREQSGRKGWFKTKQRADVIVCVYVCVLRGFTLKMDLLADHLYAPASLCLPLFLRFVWVCGGRRFRFLFCFDSVTWADCQAVYLNDDWWCLLNYGEAQTWSMAGPLRRNPSWTWVCPCPGCLGYTQVVKCNSPREGVKSRV